MPEWFDRYKSLTGNELLYGALFAFLQNAERWMPVSKTKQLLWGGFAVVLIALTVVAVLKVWPLLNPEIVATAPLDEGCDLRQGPCQARLATGESIEFAIEPRTIPVLQPLELQVRVAGLAARGVEVDFRGVDMNMGYNRPRLSAKSEGVFSGATVLPVCVRNRMLWEALVLVRTNKGIVAAPFRFETVKN